MKNMGMLGGTVIHCKELAKSIFLSVLFLSTVGFAKPVFKQGDWTLEDTMPNSKTEGQCAASTAGYFNRTIYSLSVVVDKSGENSLEIVLQPSQSPGQAAVFRTVLEGNANFLFARLAQGPKENEVLYNIPNNSAQFLNYLRQKNQINFSAVGAAGVLPLSLRGATSVLNELARRCGADAFNQNADFEKIFVPQSVQQLDPKKVTVEWTEAVRELVHSGWKAQKLVFLTEAQITALQDEFKALINERSTLTAQIDRDQQVQRPKLVRERDDADLASTNAQQDLNAARQQLIELQSQIDAARIKVNEAETAIAPHRPTFERLTSIVQQAQSRKSQAQSRLNQIDQSLKQKRQELRQREAELDELRDELPDAQALERRARRSYESAQADYNDFDVEREVDNELSRNPQYNRARRQYELATRELRQQQQNVRQAERREQQTQNELRRCLQTTPAPDCSVQEREYIAARSDLQDKQNRLRDQQREVDQLENEVRRIEERVNQEVRQHQAELLDQLNRARFELGRARDRRDEIETEISNLTRFDIPQLRADIDALIQERPRVQSNLDQAASDLAEAQAELNLFRESVGYDSLQTDLSAAQNQLSDLNTQARQTQRAIDGLNAEILKQNRISRERTQQIEELDARIDRNLQRLAAVNQALIEFDQRKAHLDAELLKRQNAVKALSGEFEALLN